MKIPCRSEEEAILLTWLLVPMGFKRVGKDWHVTNKVFGKQYLK